MVHRREIDGTAVVFGNHGALFGNAMTWWDHPTGSIWSQPLGQAFAGPLAGRRLELLPSTLTSWGAWRTSHPETGALRSLAGPGTFDLANVLIVVEIGDEAVAYPMELVRGHGLIADVVAGLDIVVLVDPADEDRWSVFVPRIDGDEDGTRLLHLEVVDGGVRDRETGSVWDPVRGRAIAGPSLGEILPRLPAFTVFEADFRTFWPDGRIWPETGD